MHISQLYKTKRPLLSFEVFPPKPDSPIDTVYETLDHLSGLNPDFISVTYGAGGGNQDRTLEIASSIKQRYGHNVLSHLTCVASTPEKIDAYLDSLKAAGIDNILALRGDVPKDSTTEEAFTHFKCSVDLIRRIKQHNGFFSIAAAAYAEVHYLAESAEQDIEFLKLKIESGASMLITQLFFDNRAFFEFLNSLRRAGVTVPVSAGIMPINDVSQIVRMTSMCGCSIPAKLARLFARYAKAPKEDVAKAGADYACEQIAELIANGVDGIHFCTMNKWRQTTDIVKSLKLR